MWKRNLIVLLVFLFAELSTQVLSSQVSWLQHLNQCKRAKCTRASRTTLAKCKDICAKDDSCEMIKYLPKQKACFTCDNQVLKKSVKCKKRFDFYVKATPHVDWTEYVRLCETASSYKRVKALTLHECKKYCARDEKCAMVKYVLKRKMCYMSDTNKRSESKSCEVKYDFYEKVIPVPHFEWVEYLDICKQATAYKKTKELTANDCRNSCAREQACAMVKYLAKRTTCWLLKTTEMKSSKSCKNNFDFYVKTLRVPRADWIEALGRCGKRSFYETVNAESAEDCKNVCARDALCAMIGYSPKQQKCSMTKSNKLPSSTRCKDKKNFYKKVVPVPEVTWINHLHTCRSSSYYVVLKTKTVMECKENCARETRCAMAKYNKKNTKCLLSKSNKLRKPKTCKVYYDFYEKDACAKKSCKKGLLCFNNGNKAKCVKKCPGGFKKKSKVCKDINECLKPTICGRHGKCENTIGSFLCSCMPGYKRHGKICKVVEKSSEKENHGVPFPAQNSPRKDLGPAIPTAKHVVTIPTPTVVPTTLPQKLPTKLPITPPLTPPEKIQKTLSTVPPEISKSGIPPFDEKNPKDDDRIPEDDNRIPGDDDRIPGDDDRIPGDEDRIPGDDNRIPGDDDRIPEDDDRIPGDDDIYPEDDDIITEDDDVTADNNGTIPENYDRNSELSERILEINEKILEFEHFSPEQNTTAEMITSSPTITTSTTETIREKVLPKVDWIAHGELCAKVNVFQPINDVETAGRCRELCEQQTQCVLVQYHEKRRLCRLSHSRTMKIMKKCRVRYDYYTKGTDECDGERKCHRNAVCRRNRGHNVCQCIYGFKGDGWDCQDINECTVYENVCGKKARCFNTIGSFRCKCKRGWISDGRTCKRRTHKSSSEKKKAERMEKAVAKWKSQHSGVVSKHSTHLQVAAAILLVFSTLL